ncbi:MAG: 50S ribosomal protein L21 [Pirellulaceae bacterium]|nr:50S ribosomal protein L21 [Pirellulaceae bacterium]
MYAIIEDGGRQYKVEEGQELKIDYRDLENGSELKFETVLAVSAGEGKFTVGKPAVSGATVLAEVLSPVRGEKLVVQKFRRRKNSKRKTGHRQLHTKVRINKISV